MIRHEIENAKCPPFESKKATAYAQEVFEVISDNARLQKVLATVLGKIDSLPFDLENNEISKSKDFVKQILLSYQNPEAV